MKPNDRLTPNTNEVADEALVGCGVGIDDDRRHSVLGRGIGFSFGRVRAGDVRTPLHRSRKDGAAVPRARPTDT